MSDWFANPIFAALDMPDLPAALDLAKTLKPVVGGFKLGLEFIHAQGPEGIRAMQALDHPMFLDVKLHDIPNTVAGGSRSLRVELRGPKVTAGHYGRKRRPVVR